MTLEDSKILAIGSINLVNDNTQKYEHITMSEIKTDTKQFNIIDKNEIAKLLESANQKYQNEKIW